jgi:hypothetical protein
MAAVVAVAVNLAVMRAFDETQDGALSYLFFACGVMPVGSVLTLVALSSIFNPAREVWLSPFVLGFEAMGWVMVFAFVTVYSTAPSEVLAFSEWIGTWTNPPLPEILERLPKGVRTVVQMGLVTGLFSFPELVVAMLGGWLNRKVGLSVRFERRVAQPAGAVLNKS